MKRSFRRVLVALAVLGGVVAALAGFQQWMISIACTTDAHKVEHLPGVTIEIKDVDCDTLAKDEAIHVYAKKTLPANAWFWTRWRNPRVLLFMYDPWRYDSPLPVVTRPSGRSIVISIPKVSSIDVQRRQWDGAPVIYHIDHIEYPAGTDVTLQHP